MVSGAMNNIWVPKTPFIIVLAAIFLNACGNTGISIKDITVSVVSITPTALKFQAVFASDDKYLRVPFQWVLVEDGGKVNEMGDMQTMGRSVDLLARIDDQKTLTTRASSLGFICNWFVFHDVQWREKLLVSEDKSGIYIEVGELHFSEVERKNAPGGEKRDIPIRKGTLRLLILRDLIDNPPSFIKDHK
jgi:hypothetical protein